VCEAHADPGGSEMKRTGGDFFCEVGRGYSEEKRSDSTRGSPGKEVDL